MELNLLEKTEVWIQDLILDNANLTQLAETVADVLSLERDQVLVVDVRHDHISLDILRRNIDAKDIFGKEKQLLAALKQLPGVQVSDETSIHSDGILGMICLNEEEASEVIKRMNEMSSQMVQKIRKRAIVFPTGFEVKLGMIEDTNTPLIKRTLEAEGYTVAVGPILDDDVDCISSRLNNAVLDGYGLIITTGGVGAEDKDKSVEGMLTIDAEAATPYIMKFRQGTGRHEKDGVRIGVGEVGQSLLVALPGPNDEVTVGLSSLITALSGGLNKHETATLIADALTKTLHKKQHWHHAMHEERSIQNAK
jgi:molybdopterin biosynthesis enzyme MoaB